MASVANDQAPLLCEAYGGEAHHGGVTFEEASQQVTKQKLTMYDRWSISTCWERLAMPLWPPTAGAAPKRRLHRFGATGVGPRQRGIMRSSTIRPAKSSTRTASRRTGSKLAGPFSSGGCVTDLEAGYPEPTTVRPGAPCCRNSSSGRSATTMTPNISAQRLIFSARRSRPTGAPSRTLRCDDRPAALWSAWIYPGVLYSFA